ncbi:Uncharacterized protein APZ42_020335 [Daphnia magna]|uniref:Uncharacterized protein n=1 Tax=Daphnia magna TaxID=35525 RepID=A0A164XLW8_9CRUS|nr:Uncharacterized protein APZ42_020335 [Daphnia magna]
MPVSDSHELWIEAVLKYQQLISIELMSAVRVGALVLRVTYLLVDNFCSALLTDDAMLSLSKGVAHSVPASDFTSP